MRCKPDLNPGRKAGAKLAVAGGPVSQLVGQFIARMTGVSLHPTELYRAVVFGNGPFDAGPQVLIFDRPPAGCAPAVAMPVFEPAFR